jgi:hypothetical protein
VLFEMNRPFPVVPIGAFRQEWTRDSGTGFPLLTSRIGLVLQHSHDNPYLVSHGLPSKQCVVKHH